MKRSIYKQDGHVDTYVDMTLNSVVAEWKKLYSADVVKASCLAQLDEVKKGVKYVIIDNRNASGVPPQETQEWFAHTLFPSFQKAGLKAIITVMSPSAITNLAAKSWISKGKPFGFDMIETPSFDQAKQFISQN